MKTDEDNFMRRDIVVNVINLGEVNFLCEKETLKDYTLEICLVTPLH